MIEQKQLQIDTPGRGTREITGEVDAIVTESCLRMGVCNLFVHHTSASLIICENADPTVRTDLETIFNRLAPDGDPAYAHDLEGPDDMAAHVRSVLTQTSLNLPFSRGRLALGTWQGIYLWEHRTSPHRRVLTVTLQGE